MSEVSDHQRPLWVGAVLASLSLAVSLPLVETVTSDDASPLSWLLSTFLGVPIGFAITLFVGLPYVLLLKHYGLLNWWSVCVGTTAAGIPLAYFFHSLFGEVAATISGSLPYGLGCGLIAGIAFCVGIGPKH